MSLLVMVLVIAVIGLITYLVLQIPMPAPFKNVIVGLVILCVVLFILQSFGLIPNLGIRLVR